MVHRSLDKATLVLRAEALLLRLQLTRLAKRFAFLIVALTFVLLALVVANVAAFIALQASIGATWSGVVVALADLVLATTALLLAMRDGSGSAEEKLTRELLDESYRSMKDELETVTEEAQRFLADLHAIRATLAGASRWLSTPLQGLLDLLRSLLDSPSKAD